MESTALPPQGAPIRKRRTRRLRLIAALPIAALALAGCTLPKFGAVAGDTTTSQSVFHLWQWFSVAAIIIGGFTFALILWAVFRYRRKSDDVIPRQVQYHLPAEVLYTIIPILVIVGLFVATLVVENKVVANPKTKVNVDVLAFQWGWKFTYPGTYALVYGQIGFCIGIQGIIKCLKFQVFKGVIAAEGKARAVISYKNGRDTLALYDHIVGHRNRPSQIICPGR